MRVALDLLYLVPGETGGRETYARELVPALIECAPELELVAFVNRDAGDQLAAELGPGVRSVVLPLSSRNRAQWALGELVNVSLAARRARVELVHSLANFAPCWGGFRRVVTIHDLHYKAVPELLSWRMRAGTAALVALAATRADRIIAVSAAGRDEIVAGLRVAPTRVDVVQNGVRLPAVAPSVAELDAVRQRHRLTQRSIALAVASNLPHKNLPTLIEALALIEPAIRPLLVIAGEGTDDGQLQRRADAAGIGEGVRLLGVRSREELEVLYALAACVVMPTLHEGFGLPAVEAMARSVPVACSDIPALREVAGEAALYFDPRDREDIAAKVSELVTTPSLSQHLRHLGRARAAQFSWRSAAEGTLASYRRALAA